MDIVQLIYRPCAPQGASKDYEFSRATMRARWQQGLSDASITLCAAPWLAYKPHHGGVRVFDVLHDQLLARGHAGATAGATPRGGATAPATDRRTEGGATGIPAHAATDGGSRGNA